MKNPFGLMCEEFVKKVLINGHTTFDHFIAATFSKKEIAEATKRVMATMSQEELDRTLENSHNFKE